MLAVMQTLPDVLASRSRLHAPLIPAKMIDAAMVNGPWKRLGAGHPAHEGGTVNRRALRAGLTRSQRPGAGRSRRG